VATVILTESNTFSEYESRLGLSPLSYGYKFIDSPASADEDDRDIYPVSIPHAGYLWSCVKWWRFKCTDLAGSTSVGTFRIWFTGSFPSEMEVYVATSSSYRVSGPFHSYDTSWTPSIGVTWYPASTNYYDATHYLSVPGTITANDGYSSYFCHALRVSSLAEEMSFSDEPYLCFNYVLS
jgi:hypothetical protein